MKILTLIILSSMLTLCLLGPTGSQAQTPKKKAKTTTRKGTRKAVAKTSAASASQAVDSKKAEPTAAAPESKAVAADKAPPAGKPIEAEPTEVEMQEALLNTAANRGGQKTSDGTISTNNALAGASVKIEGFEKLGCKPANFGAGYFCTYNITTSMSLHSNDGTAAGNNQAAAWNTLLRVFNGGRNSSTATATMRFVRGKAGWIASKD